MPRVSIIVPAYNCARYLPAAIDSVIRQTFADWELIIVNDGSTDDTPSVVSSYSHRLGTKLRYVYQSNRGVSAARNAAIQESRGEFVAILDADDVWLPARLARGVAVMDSNPAVGLVHSQIARVNSDGAVVDYHSFPPRYQAGQIAVDIFTRRANVLSPSVLLRKRCLDVVGLFDETMHATEDRDLWFRIAERYEVAYIHEILAHYRVSTGSATSDPDRMLNGQLFFVYKHYRRHACSRVALHRALGQVYREQGDFFFSRGQLLKSLGHYSRSVLYNPLNLKNVYMLLRAGAEPFLPGLLTERTAKVYEGKPQ